jgi:succinate-acetate transporter protein
MHAPAQNAPLPFGEPTPLGLLGLSIGCGALLPIAFGMIPSEPAQAAAMFATAAWFCLLFGAGCQFLAGLMSLANKNTLGGTLLTTFSFNWVMNWYTLSEAAQGRAVDATVGFSVDVTFLLIFVVLTYAFGFYSKLLFFFLLDIDVLYVLRIARHLLGHGHALAGPLGLGVGIATVVLMGIALYISFALLVNPAAGRAVFPASGPMFRPAGPPAAGAAS